MISINLNGQPKEIPGDTTAAALVESLEIGRRKFAVEVNREVVSAHRLGEVILSEGDEVNVVTLVGGG